MWKLKLVFLRNHWAICNKFHRIAFRKRKWKLIHMSLVTLQIWQPCSYIVKNLKKPSSLEPREWLPWNLVCSTHHSLFKWWLAWPWSNLLQSQIWSHMLLYGKKWKLLIFFSLPGLCPRRAYVVTQALASASASASALAQCLFSKMSIGF